MVKYCILCGSEDIQLSVIFEQGRSCGTIVRKCAKYEAGHTLDLEDFPNPAGNLIKYTCLELKSLLKNWQLSTSGLKMELINRLSLRYENELKRHLEGGSPPPAAPEIKESSKGLGECFRSPVSHLRDQCNELDNYSVLPWQDYTNPQVDHVIEVQVIGYAWNTMNTDARRTRAQEQQISLLVNDVNNLNVTSREINLAKGGRGGVFERAIHDLQCNIYRADDDIHTYYTRSKSLSRRIEQNINSTVVNSWETLNSLLQDQSNKTTSEHFRERMQQVLFDELKIEG